MSNKKQSQKDRPNTANPAHPSKLHNPKKGSGNPRERNNLQADQEKQPEDKIVTGQSDNDVNGNELDTNLKHSPAH